MQTDYIFSHVHEDAKEKETEVTNKRGCCECLRLLRGTQQV